MCGACTVPSPSTAVRLMVWAFTLQAAREAWNPMACSRTKQYDMGA